MAVVVTKMKPLLAGILALSAAVLPAAVKIEHKQNTRGQIEANTYRVLNASPIRYSINYNIRTKDGVRTVGDRSASSTGIGLNNGWYANGFLRIYVDGKSLTVPAARTVGDGVLVFKWDKAVLKMHFPEGSDKIYCEISAPGVRRLKIGFLAVPGFLPKRKDEFKPYVSTAKVNHLLTDGKYQSAGESWFMLYDGISNRNGIPAVILDPAEIKSGVVSGSAKTLLITAHFEMNRPVCRFIVMGFPNSHLDAESFYEDLKANGKKYLEELKSFRF